MTDSGEYRNEEALAKLPKGRRKIVEYIIRQQRPVLLVMYEPKYDILHTGHDFQLLVVTHNQVSAEQDLDVIHYADRFNEIVHAWFNRVEQFRQHVIKGRLLAWGVFNGSVLLYASDIRFYRMMESLYRTLHEKESTTVYIGADSANASKWRRFSAWWYDMGKYAMKKGYHSIAAYAFHLASEIALKAKLLESGKRPQKLGQDILAIVNELGYTHLQSDADHLQSIHKIISHPYPPQGEFSISSHLPALEASARRILRTCGVEVSGSAASASAPGRSSATSAKRE